MTDHGWPLPILGYKHRSEVLDLKYAQQDCPRGNGVFANTLVVGGRVVGTWKRTIRRKAGASEIAFDQQPFQVPSKAHDRLCSSALGRYASFWGG